MSKNAVHAICSEEKGGKNPEIFIRLFLEDSLGVIEIEDNGPGIDAQLVQRVLQRGVRADQAVEGQGIGLAIVTDITQAYNGIIEITNINDGGSCICVKFPL